MNVEIIFILWLCISTEHWSVYSCRPTRWCGLPSLWLPHSPFLQFLLLTSSTGPARYTNCVAMIANNHGTLFHQFYTGGVIHAQCRSLSCFFFIHYSCPHHTPTSHKLFIYIPSTIRFNFTLNWLINFSCRLLFTPCAHAQQGVMYSL